jgi:hypothetical protein
MYMPKTNTESEMENSQSFGAPMLDGGTYGWFVSRLG